MKQIGPSFLAARAAGGNEGAPVSYQGSLIFRNGFGFSESQSGVRYATTGAKHSGDIPNTASHIGLASRAGRNNLPNTAARSMARSGTPDRLHSRRPGRNRRKDTDSTHHREPWRVRRTNPHTNPPRTIT